MFDDAVQDVKAHVESVVSAKVDELKERIAGLLSVCAKEASVREESDAVKVLLSTIEMRFREEHAALVEAISANTAATKAQTGLLEVLCNEMKAMNGKMDVLCSHTARLENIEQDVATITNAFQAVEEKVGVVSSRVSGLSEHVDDIRLVSREKTDVIKRAGREAVGRRGGKTDRAPSGLDSPVLGEKLGCHGKWGQRAEGVDGEGECDNHLRQHG